MRLELRRDRSRYHFASDARARDIIGLESEFQNYLDEVLGLTPERRRLSSLSENPWYYSLIALYRYIEERCARDRVPLPARWRNRLERFFYHTNHARGRYHYQGSRLYRGDIARYLDSTDPVVDSLHAYVRYAGKLPPERMTEEIRAEVARRTRTTLVAVISLLRTPRLTSRQRSSLESIMSTRVVFYPAVYRDLKRDLRSGLQRCESRDILKRIRCVARFIWTLETKLYEYLTDPQLHGEERLRVPSQHVPKGFSRFASLAGFRGTTAELCRELQRLSSAQLFHTDFKGRPRPDIELPSAPPTEKRSYLTALRNMREFMKQKGIL